MNERSTSGGLGTAWERRVWRSARLGAVVAASFAVLVGLALRDQGLPLWLTLAAAAALGVVVHGGMLGKLRRRRRLLNAAFPAAWEAVLQADVVFFRALDERDRVRFRREVQVFLGEKRITGIRVPLDTRTRVLAAASAVIPIFGFQDWEWDEITEVLIYPGRFDTGFNVDGGQGNTQGDILGMVGTGAMNRVMILSKPDLLQGFKNAADKRNVGLHEFAHLVDKTDGVIDGVPAVGLDRQAIGPWVDLVRRKMQEIADGQSDLNPYALTNEAEFFAVATEYFFERPELMARKHPELFAGLERVFAQDLSSRLTALRRELKRGPVRFGRNSPCPCGSGKKYKKCCLGR